MLSFHCTVSKTKETGGQNQNLKVERQCYHPTLNQLGPAARTLGPSAEVEVGGRVGGVGVGVIRGGGVTGGGE
ncbi:hypothetical protein ElyMa_004084200 [Elysia marginata]|uniref:Uncharacterized protein n=1 Tax=Elysia marginata TaxID=1093978 RepID=A0AAV4G8J1_9GAST|nr:hypothetical protein ElyMa_004084200 [Elysia marginata]